MYVHLVYFKWFQNCLLIQTLILTDFFFLITLNLRFLSNINDQMELHSINQKT